MTTSTKEWLENNGIKSAIVVDDAYDPTPTAADLHFDQDQWDIFVDDLDDADVSTLQSVYPTYVPGQEANLFRQDKFIASVWDARTQFRPEHIDLLFKTYIDDSEHDSRVVSAVETQLHDLALSVQTAGRNFVDAATAVDLIVIDLFLGAQQNELDMRKSLKGLAQVVQQRTDNPPVIILMSRSGQLADHAQSFRDDAGIFASGFRTIAKADIEKPDRLEHLIRELARHRQDSLKLNTFLRRWIHALSGAIQRTGDDIRRLDLEDWAQIRDLLLTAEGSSVGRYILEVFELAFLHELESDDSIVTAAAALDTLERETYPPTTITGSKDSLGLVAKTLYEHDKCRQLDAGATAPVAFGDIIGPFHSSQFPKHPAFASLDSAVLIAMTPACDLQRGEASQILFMVGKTKDLDAPAAAQATTGLHTPILNLPDDKRVWVNWETTNPLTLSSAEVYDLLSDAQNSVARLARLRTANAVALQQQLLGNLGRVGLVAPMPSTFPIQIAVYYPSAEGLLSSLSIGGQDTLDAVCYVGRGDDHKFATAPFDSIHRFDFLEALEGLPTEQVHRSSIQTVVKFRQVEVLDLLFSRGLQFKLTSSKAQQWKPIIGAAEVDLAKVIHRQPASETLSAPNQFNQAGLVFEIRGLPLSVSD